MSASRRQEHAHFKNKMDDIYMNKYNTGNK